MRWFNILIIGFSACFIGCEEDKQCADFASNAIVYGTRTDYTTKAGDYAGYNLSEPTLCDVNSEKISINGTGSRSLGYPVPTECNSVPDSGAGGSGGSSCPVVSSWTFLADVEDSLRAASIQTYDPWTCTGRGHGILINDWRKSDETAALVTAKVAEWGLGDTFDIVVGPVQYACY